jgi:hypothetical protein
MLDKDSIAYYNLLFLKSRIKNNNNKKKNENISVIDTGRKLIFNREEKKGDNEKMESEIRVYVYE